MQFQNKQEQNLKLTKYNFKIALDVKTLPEVA